MSNEEAQKVLGVLFNNYRARAESGTLNKVSPELAEWNLGVSDGIHIALELLSGAEINVGDFM